MLHEPLIEPLRRFWALGEERIILASALTAHLRKRANAQRFVLSTCKAGALPTELRPHVLMSIVMSQQTRKEACVTPILSREIAQRLKSVCFSSRSISAHVPVHPEQL